MANETAEGKRHEVPNKWVTITRVFEFDAAHRIMDEKVKCFNLHGHRFKVEVKLLCEFAEEDSIGYAIDFKDLKKVVGETLDDLFDHSVILNPKDKDLIEFVESKNWKLYVMQSDTYKNPTAENLAAEIFDIIDGIFVLRADIKVESIKFYETPNCWVEVNS